MEFAKQFDRDANVAFARLSGDFNPLHLDPVFARRTQFGGSVVHGIHVVIHAVDRAFGAGIGGQAQPAAISCTFHNPVKTGETVRFEVTVDVERGRLKLTGHAEDRLAFSASVELREFEVSGESALPDRAFEPQSPRDGDRRPEETDGAIPLQLDRGLLRELFPALASRRSFEWVADLLATTRIVGMECPGLHSIYAAFRLQRVPPDDAVYAGSMRYRPRTTNARFGLARIAVAGNTLSGTVEAFSRPRPVKQVSLVDLCNMDASAYAGQRAIVVGGSRGLGEVTAKILLAGGADVTITYARGEDDARRIRDEAVAQRRVCDIAQLDVTAGGRVPVPPGAAPYTHVYYFASPAIAKNTSGQWDHALFERFAVVYVDAFASLCGELLMRTPADHPPLRIFYPSTVFLDAPENGFGEYCAAKAAGEALCDHLQRFHRAVVARPRLPRTRTDQTIGLLDVDLPDAFTVINAVLPQFHSDRAK